MRDDQRSLGKAVLRGRGGSTYELGKQEKASAHCPRPRHRSVRHGSYTVPHIRPCELLRARAQGVLSDGPATGRDLEDGELSIGQMVCRATALLHAGMNQAMDQAACDAGVRYQSTPPLAKG